MSTSTSQQPLLWKAPQGIALSGSFDGRVSTIKVLATKEFKAGELILQERAPIWSSFGQLGLDLLNQPWCKLMSPR